MAEKLPIIYVRGFAGATSGIDTATDDPFYGFNAGSTHVRVGAEGKPSFYQFEGPLLRLIDDEQYTIAVEGDQARYLDRQPDGSVSPATIWIHRFYDEAASTFGDKAKGFDLEEAARDLLSLIEVVGQKTGAPQVYLVAHSMGGLICRSMIQKVIPEAGGNRLAAQLVKRFFTYATPHGGISFSVGFGLIEALRDFFDVAGSDIFGPKRMYGYLTPTAHQDKDGPPKGWRGQDMPDTPNFPLDQVFCLVGTNAKDYGLPSKVVGVQSDGLVQIQNAYVPGATRNYAHRSHSGRYGIVNSEEGYQNLKRFLFGDIKVAASLVGVVLPGDPKLIWQGEVAVAIRTLPSLIDDQSAAHYCPISLSPLPPGAELSVPLATTFLQTKLAPKGEACRYAVHLRLLSLREAGGIFHFGDHLEQTADFDDYLIVDLKPKADGSGFEAWAEWQSAIGERLGDYKPQGNPLADQAPAAGVWQTDIAFPVAKFGPNAALRLTATPR